MRIRKIASWFFIIALLLVNTDIPARAVTPTELQQQIQSETAVLIDGDTGQVLFDKNMHRQMSPASITKIMTALLALENADLGDVITMTHDAVFAVTRGSSHIALDTDEQLTMEDAMYALAIASANDAANGIAEHVGGTLDHFAEMMNLRAKEAGALHTHFANANGLPDPNHYTTAYDMAMITMQAIKTPYFTDIFSTQIYEMSPTNKQEEPRTFWRKSALILGRNQYDGCIMEKTGWTNDAQHTFVAAAQRDGRTLIAVVMKSSVAKDKLMDTTMLFDYGFDEFIRVNFAAGELSKENYQINDAHGHQAEIDISTPEGFSCLIPKSLTRNDITVNYITENVGADDSMRVKAVFTLPPSYARVAELGELEMFAHLKEPSGDAAPVNVLPIESAQPQESEEPEHAATFPSIVTWILCVIGVILGIFVVLYVRRYLIIRRRRRGRRFRRMNGV